MEIQFSLDTTKPSTRGQPMTAGELIQLLSGVDPKLTVAIRQADQPEFCMMFAVGEMTIDSKTVYGVLLSTQT